MTAVKFDDIVKNLANQNVQKRIECFEAEVGRALGKLFHCQAFSTDWLSTHHPAECAALQVLTSTTEKPGVYGWPQKLWTEEEARVAEQLLDQLDIVQQAMLAKPPSDHDNRPGVEG